MDTIPLPLLSFLDPSPHLSATPFPLPFPSLCRLSLCSSHLFLPSALYPSPLLLLSALCPLPSALCPCPSLIHLSLPSSLCPSPLPLFCVPRGAPSYCSYCSVVTPQFCLAPDQSSLTGKSHFWSVTMACCSWKGRGPRSPPTPISVEWTRVSDKLHRAAAGTPFSVAIHWCSAG